MRVRWTIGLLGLVATLLTSCDLLASTTPSATWEPLPTIVPSATPMPPTITSTAAPSATATFSPLPSRTPTATPKPTSTAQSTSTPICTVQPSATSSPQPSVTATPTPQQDATGTSVATVVPRATAAGTPQSSELVESWVGVVVALPEGSTYDDYFTAEQSGRQYGITSLVTAIRSQLEAYRATGTRVRVWGVLDYGIADYGGVRITVTRVDPVVQ